MAQRAVLDEAQAPPQPDWGPELWTGLQRTRSFLARASDPARCRRISYAQAASIPPFDWKPAFA
jgi:hypothetical protein